MDTQPHTIYVDEVDNGRLPIVAGNYRQSMAPPTPPPYHATRRFHDQQPFINDEEENNCSNEIIRSQNCAMQNDRIEIDYRHGDDDSLPLESLPFGSLITDRGWAWAVLFASFFCYMVADGWSYSLPELKEELQKDFNSTESVSSLIVTAQYSIPLLISPVVCALTNFLGIRIVGILGGAIMFVYMIISAMAPDIYTMIAASVLLAGIGLSMIYVSTMIAVCFYFEKYRGIAIGIAVTGSGIGSTLFPYIVGKIIQMSSWRIMFYVMSSFCLLVSIISAIFYKPFPKVVEEIDTKEKTCNITSRENKKWISKIKYMFSTIASLLCNPKYLLFCVSSFVLYLVASAPYTYLYQHCIDNGHSDDQALQILMSIGISRTMFQIVIGVVSDISPTKCTSTIYAFIIIITGIFSLGISLSPSHTYLLIYSIAYGICNAAFYTQQMLIIVHIVKLDMVTTAFGFFQFVIGVGIQIGIPIIGLLKETTGNFNLSFNITGVLFIISGLLLLPLPFIKRRCR